MSNAVLDKFDQAIASIESHDAFAFDIETTGLDPFTTELLVLSLATEDGAWAIPFAGPVPHLYWNDPEMSSRIAHVFSNPEKLGITWNGSFDIKNLIKRGFKIRTRDADGMIGIWLLDEYLARTKRIGLKKQAKEKLGVTMKEFDETNLIDGIVDDEAMLYAADDSKYTYIIYFDHIKPKLEEEGLTKVFEKVCMPVLRVVVEMELNGCYLDVNKLHDVEVELLKQNSAVLETLQGISGNPKFNPGSSKQLATLLFGPNSKLHIPVKRGHEWKIKSKQWSTDKRTLRRYKKDHTIFERLTEYRKSKKALTTYAIPLQERAKAAFDGRVRPGFKQWGTVTGRMCIAKGTMIDVARDVSKHPAGIVIEDVKPGDYVYCYDDDFNIRIKRVVWAGKTGHKGVLRVNWAGTGENSAGHVDTTPEHKVRLSNGNYCCADALKQGNILLGLSLSGTEAYSRSHVEVTSVDDRGDVIDVYDLEVEDCNNFIANGICVHNSSSNPNGQNIPTKGGIRESFIAPVGKKIVVADYNQLELRVGGLLAFRALGRSNIVEKYRQGLDLHEATRQTYDALGIERFNEAAVGKEEARRNAKVCVTGDTLLTTDNGLIRIDSIVDQSCEGRLRPIGSKVAVASDINTLPIESIYFGGIKKVVAVTTEHGLRLRCTPDHRFVVIRSGKIRRTKLCDLRIGDHVLMRSGTRLFGDSARLSIDAVGGATCYREWTPPKELTGDACRALGYLAAEGSWGGGSGHYVARISIRPDDADIVSDLRACWTSTFGERGRTRAGDNLITFSASSKDVVFWLDEIGLGSGASSKRVPQAILKAPFNLQREFLRGIFTGDGYAASGHRIVGITLKSEECIRQIQLMLLNIGIVSWVKKEERQQYGSFWALRMYGAEALRFIGDIGFASSAKNAAISTVEFTKSTRYLAGVTCLLEDCQESSHGLLLDKLTECVAGKVKFGDRRLALLPKEDVPETLQWARNGGLWSTKIVALDEAGDEPVYDIVEPEKRLFVTNGILTEDCNFGYFYGRSADAFAQDNPEIRFDEATNLREIFLTKMYPEISGMHDHMVKVLVETGMVKTLLGRRRRFKYCYARDPSEVWWDGWIGWNSATQGSAQDIIQLAMRNLYADITLGRSGGDVISQGQKLLITKEEWQEVKILLQVHDELMIEAPENVAEIVATWMSFTMEAALSGQAVSFPAEAGVGNNWVEAKAAPKNKKKPEEEDVAAPVAAIDDDDDDNDDNEE